VYPRGNGKIKLSLPHTDDRLRRSPPGKLTTESDKKILCYAVEGSLKLNTNVEISNPWSTA